MPKWLNKSKSILKLFKKIFWAYGYVSTHSKEPKTI